MTNEKKVVALAGATGLVGGFCLRALLANTLVQRILVLGRRPPPLSDPRVEARTVDFADLPSPGQNQPIDAALCALGTTIKAAGSEQSFRAVDQNAVLAFARWVRAHNCRTFVVVSSVGATATARNFYLRVKGETEAELCTLGFDRLVILRPGLLLGKRLDNRLGEAVAQSLLPVAGALLVGRLDRYRAIKAEAVAQAMAKAAFARENGTLIWHNREILSRG